MITSASLENWIYDRIRIAIHGISANQAFDIYAMSFWVSAEDDDPRRQSLRFSYNTYSHAKASEPHASDAAEAKWNFAFWLEDDDDWIGGNDAAFAALRSAWLDECGLGYTDDDEIADLDRCLDLGERIEDAFWTISANVAKKLHDSGIVSQKFGKSIPIVIHNLEYYAKVVETTIRANPKGVADEFVKWIEQL